MERRKREIKQEANERAAVAESVGLPPDVDDVTLRKTLIERDL